MVRTVASTSTTAIDFLALMLLYIASETQGGEVSWLYLAGLITSRSTEPTPPKSMDFSPYVPLTLLKE